MKTVIIMLVAIGFSLCKEKPPVNPDPIPAGLYIAPDGNDSNPCTYENPCKTISATLSKLKGGDTLHIRGGEYNEGEVWIRGDFQTAPDKYITIKAFKKEIPLFSNGVRHIIIESDYISIDGLHFTNAKFIAQVNSHIGAKITRNKFFGGGWGWGVISVEGSDIIISENTIDISGSTVGSSGHGIYVHAGNNIEVSKNIISGTSGYGIHVFDQKRTEDHPGMKRRITNVRIVGNIISKSSERAGIIVAAQEPDAFADNILIAQNIIYDCAGDGIRLIAQVNDVKIWNNTIYAIDADGIVWNGSDGIFIGKEVTKVEMKNNLIHLGNNSDARHIWHENTEMPMLGYGLYWPLPFKSNLTDAHAVMQDPLFVNINSGDFKLKSGSPAIDKGINVGLPYKGKSPDIGAIEF